MKITIPELEDLSWFPSKLRQMQMEFIGFMVVFLKVYEPVLNKINKALEKSTTRNILDLCSGSGEPIRNLSKLGIHVDSIILSDLYPQTNLESANISWHSEPINALELHNELDGMRTMFNAYHHFNDEEKLKILQSHGTKGIFIAEILQPNLFNLIKIIFTTVVGQLIFTPFIKPFSFQRLLFTYLIPINLITVTWDGIISVLKSQNPETMFKQASDSLNFGYYFDSGVSGPFWARVSWLYVIKD
ncbi:MAG: hypothetical protein WED33_06080 [Bacteroidia bacterium]